MAAAHAKRQRQRPHPKRTPSRPAKAWLVPGGVSDHWTGDRIRELRRRLPATQEEFAQILDVASSSVHRWEAGRVEADRRTCEKMSSLKKIVSMLDKHFRAEGRVEFFRTPQPRLDDDRPMDLLGLPSAEKRIGVLVKSILAGDFS
jgi:DNA-binding XRE family transcriptional regulator